VNTWRSTPDIKTWTAALAPLNHDMVRSALNALSRADNGHPAASLSTDDFIAAYRRSGGRHTPGCCELCSGTGVDGEEYLIIGGERGEAEGWAIEYRIPLRCRCSKGQQFPRSEPPVGVEYRYSDTPLDRRSPVASGGA
jgi:hypothetical protein